MASKVRVLLADDNREYTLLLSEYILSHAGLELVGVTHDGRETLEAAKLLSPDVIVLDMVMPELDGLAVLSGLGSELKQKKTGVIVLTALGQEDMTRRSLELGASYYVLKPFDFEVLLERVLQIAEDLRREPGVPGLSSDTLERAGRELQELSIPMTLTGYTYLRTAIAIAVGEPRVISRVTHEVYPIVAKLHGTTAARVERAMRHAVSVCWQDGHNEKAVRFFGLSSRRRCKRPTNSEFIALVADKLRREK